MAEATVREDNRGIKPPGPEQGVLSQVFLEVFSYTTLELFIRQNLGLNPDDIYTPGDVLPQRVNKLLDAVDRTDRWFLLLMEACGYRPSNERLLYECARILRVTEEELFHRVRARQFSQSLEHCFPERVEVELREILRTELKRDLDALSSKGAPYSQRLDELIQKAEQEDWLKDFARSAFLYRPYDITIKSFLRNFYPELADEKLNTGQRVSSGMDALLRIIQDPNMGAIKTILKPRIPDFNRALMLLERLNKYKGLHAQLHRLQLSLTATQFALNNGQGGKQYSRPILDCVKEARRYAKGLPNESNESVWIDSLEWAATQIDLLGRPGTQVSVRTVIDKLWEAPDEAPRISERIATIAMDIPLTEISAGFTEVKRDLGANSTLVREGSIEEFFSGASLLQQIKPWLDKLTQDHFDWQMLEKHLQAAESMDGDSLSVRIPRWQARVRPALIKLCGASATTEWAQELIKTIEQLEGEDVDTTIGDFDRGLESLQVQVDTRFFDVDEELLDVSTELTQIIRPLQQLVQLISS